MKKILVIDGSIGRYGFSKQWLNYMLKDSENDEIEIQISSLGGEVDHALAIHDRLAQHGNVTCILSGFVASSATVIPLGTKLIKMSQNSMYLIHKPMKWINEFDTMNEDDIDTLIERLKNEKQELEKVTLLLAKMYALKSGKAVKEILTLMKKETWLSADEAKEWGFIDEVYTPSKIVNFKEDLAMVAMIQANGLPSPSTSTTEIPQVDESSLVSKIIAGIKQIIKPTPTNQTMIKQFLNLNKVLKVEKLESTNEGIYLNQEQLSCIDNQLAEHDQAVTARTTAENSLTSATSALDTIDPSIMEAKTVDEKITAIKALIAKKPGSSPSGTKGKQDLAVVNDGADWETLNSLPHMKEID